MIGEIPHELIRAAGLELLAPRGAIKTGEDAGTHLDEPTDEHAEVWMRAVVVLRSRICDLRDGSYVPHHAGSAGLQEFVSEAGREPMTRVHFGCVPAAHEEHDGNGHLDGHDVHGRAAE